MSSAATAHVNSRRAITQHFAGRASPPSETAMRAHFLDCPSCRQLYDRHLLMARLDPCALSPQERLAPGLGFSRLSRDRTWMTAWSFSVAAVAVLLLIPWTLHRSDGSGARGDDDPGQLSRTGFAVRGEAHGGGPWGDLWTYRLQGATSPQLVHDSLGADDELAFAYANPTGKAYVMVFGVDEHRHVFWFHPAWAAGQPPPAAVAAVAGPGPHELPGAIRHAFDGGQLSVYAVFSDQALDVLTVERHVQASAATGSPTPAGPGVESVRRVFQMKPR